MRPSFPASHHLLTLLTGFGLLAATPGPGSAQDTHYWTYQYGASADLLGGMVVGDVLDLSTTFYNPGGLALFTKPSLILSAKGYEFTSVDLRNEGQSVLDLNSSHLAEGPGLFAGTFTPGSDRKLHLGYSFLTRQTFDLNFEARGSAEGEVLPEDPGIERFGGELILNQGLSEIWGGITVARALGDRAGVGATTYLAYRKQKTRAFGLVEILSENDDFAIAIRTSEIDYDHARLLWKIGGILRAAPVSLGLTVTTPSVGLFGSGWALVNRTTSGIDLTGDGNPDDVVTADYQDNVGTTIKSPLSVAVGAAWDLGATRVYVTSEWFATLDRYDVLDTQPFVSQTLGDTLMNGATHAAASVLNAGVGVEQELGEKTRFYGAFRTDFSNVVPTRGRDITFSTWDIYHLSAGAGFRIKRFELTLGLAYSFGDEGVQEPFEITDPGDRTAIDPIGPIDVRYRRIKVLAGLNLSL